VTLPQSFFYPPGAPVPTPVPTASVPNGDLCGICTVNGEGENVVHGAVTSPEAQCYAACTAAHPGGGASGTDSCTKQCEDQCNGCSVGLGCYTCNEHCTGGYTERRCSYPEAPGNQSSDGQFGGDGYNFN